MELGAKKKRKANSMIKLKIISFAILTLAISCSQRSKNLNNKNIEPKFSNYLQKIEPLELPYQAGCIEFIDFDNMTKNSALIDTTYSLNWEIPFKRIKTEKNFEIVIYLMPADIFIPIVKTFDLNGNEISKLMIFSNCDGEPGFRERQFFTIHKDFQIIKTDSVWTWELDNDHNEIKSTEKINVTKSYYSIENNGLILHKLEL